MKLFRLPCLLLFVLTLCSGVTEARPFYIYTLRQNKTAASYDEAVAVACVQGILNRDEPELYVVSTTNSRPDYWLGILSSNGRWLQNRPRRHVKDLNALIKLARRQIKGAIIWDTNVPATINVATTMAGLTDGIVLSPSLADRFLKKWHLKVIEDFRGKFTGAETGSAKNDAYRWAIHHFLDTDLCSAHRLCLFEDAFATRSHGDASYVVTRDWAVKNRAFVFDLSPWGDENPGDDPHQLRGTDLETYKRILAATMKNAAGREMTELTGFFALSKYSQMPDHASIHLGVPTEWQSVALMTPCNVYQNTISSYCFNQSFHSHAPRHPLRQHPAQTAAKLEKKTYLCVLMSDYDSATPLYDYLPTHWHDAARGKLPLIWGINPSLLETYPDLIAYFYETATPMDTFASDASAAGYMNPDLIKTDQLPLFVAHNQKYFREADMTIAPMVLDQNPPTPAVKDAFSQFAPDGYGTIVNTLSGARGEFPPPQDWKGMPIMELLNDACNSTAPDTIAGAMANAIASRGAARPGFYLFRTDWVNPRDVRGAMELLRKQHPEWECELLPAGTFFRLFKESLAP